nr:hypothetical protein [Streptomyces sp. 2323.1]
MDEGEVAACFGEQVAAVEVAVAVHHEHRGGDVDGRQADVDHGGDPGSDRSGRGAGALKKGVDEVGAGGKEGPRAGPPVVAQLRQGAGLRLGRAGLASSDPVQLRPCRLGDLGRELQVPVVVGGGDVLALQVREAGGDLLAATGGPADQLVRHPGDLHHRSAPGRDRARLGRQAKGLTRLSHHDFVVER